MEKKIIRFQVSKIHALPGFDDCYLHLSLGPEFGNRKVGWVHFQASTTHRNSARRRAPR